MLVVFVVAFELEPPGREDNRYNNEGSFLISPIMSFIAWRSSLVMASSSFVAVILLVMSWSVVLAVVVLVEVVVVLLAKGGSGGNKADLVISLPGSLRVVGINN